MGRIARIVALTGATTLIGIFTFGTAASAHVTVHSDDATQGGEARVTFRVPDESDTLSTTKLQVYLPTDQPLADVLVMPVPGWSATMVTTKLATPIKTDDGDTVTDAVSQITWTATTPTTAIKPGQFQEFSLSAGPLPKADSMVFKALQTYSDGSIVRWIDPTVAGQPEPDHAAPVLALAADTSTSAAPTTAAAPTSGPTVTATQNTGSDTGALTIGVIALLLSLIAAALGALAFTRTRRPTT